MRKAAFIVLGLVLLTGAAGMGLYRHLVLPGQSAVARHAAPPVLREDAKRGAGPDRKQPEDAKAPESGGAGWNAVQMALDVLNIVIGAVGIWLAVAGIRMQRQIMTMQQNGNRRA